ncbi:MAG: hypothetical protein ACRD9L_02105 [Bryobacteraceae bacterium]
MSTFDADPGRDRAAIEAGDRSQRLSGQRVNAIPRSRSISGKDLEAIYRQPPATMESALLAVVLDSSIVITAERRSLPVPNLHESTQATYGEIGVSLSPVMVARTCTWDLRRQDTGGKPAPP